MFTAAVSGGVERKLEIPIYQPTQASGTLTARQALSDAGVAGDVKGGDTFNINMNIEGKTLRDMNTLSQFADMAKIRSRMTAGVNN